MNIDDKLVEILACPKCNTKVQAVEDGLLCTQCRLKFPVRDDIPIMLLSEAVSVDADKAS